MDVSIGSIVASAVVLLVANRYTNRALDKIEALMTPKKEKQTTTPTSLGGCSFTVRKKR